MEWSPPPASTPRPGLGVVVLAGVAFLASAFSGVGGTTGFLGFDRPDPILLRRQGAPARRGQRLPSTRPKPTSQQFKLMGQLSRCQIKVFKSYVRFKTES